MSNQHKPRTYKHMTTAIAPEGASVELILDDHLSDLEPPPELQACGVGILSPKRYYITSGDAIRKSDKLTSDIYAYAGKVRQIIGTGKFSAKAKEFEKHCWTMAGKSLKLTAMLKVTRGSAVFLETEWLGGGVLIVKPKNPRPKP